MKVTMKETVNIAGNNILYIPKRLTIFNITDTYKQEKNGYR